VRRRGALRQGLQGSQQTRFRQSVDYTENRKVKNSRQARAMAKGTRYGREAQEAAWQNAEVGRLYRLAAPAYGCRRRITSIPAYC